MVLVAFLLTLAVGLETPLSLRILGLTRRLSGAQAAHGGGNVVSDLLTRSVVRKVKVSRIGDYLVVTLVLRTGADPGAEVEIEEPLVLFSDGDVIAKGVGAEELAGT